MLHCVSLPYGNDIFWKLIKDEFHNSDWRIRFNAGKIILFKYMYSSNVFVIYICYVMRHRFFSMDHYPFFKVKGENKIYFRKIILFLADYF